MIVFFRVMPYVQTMEGKTMSESEGVGVRYPFINLEKAVSRAEALYKADPKGREMGVTAAFSVWEYSEKSSGGFQTVAALKMYGLVKYLAKGDARKIALSDEALRYFRDEREDVRQGLLQGFALRPRLVAALWKDWKISPPADAIARSHLKADRGLGDQAARSFLAIYKENLAFAGVKGDAKVTQTEEEDEAEVTEPPSSPHNQAGRTPPPLPPLRGRVPVMDSERVVFTEEAAPNQYLKLVASGDVDDFLLEALEDYVKRQRKIRAFLKRSAGEAKKPEWADKTFSPGDTVPGSTIFRSHHVDHDREQLIEPDEGETFPACDKCGDKVRYTLA